MVMLKTSTALMALLATTSCYTTFASPQNTTAPLANDLRGVHLLLENDVDSSTPKYPVILLSHPRTYNDSQMACASLGENLVAPTFGNLSNLLNNTPVAHNELQTFNLLWTASEGKNNNSMCTAFDRSNGQTQQRPCNETLPSICSNSMPRYIFMEANTTSQIKINTANFGVWQGYRDQNQFRFLGIPYAEPPVGKLRFMDPVAANANKFIGADKVNNATRVGNACKQLNYGNPPMSSEMEIRNLGAVTSEDCLYLNVFTPSFKSEGTKGLPVMVYVHGGSFTDFSGSTPFFEPGNLVSRAGVVVVTLNYRLSSYGLFDIPGTNVTGNVASRDQVEALKWVQKNIASFGGDPNLVTIFGESAGAWSMRALLSTPSAFDLYHNVISVSDLMGLPLSSQNFSSVITELTMKAMGCNFTDVTCAQNKTVDEIQTAQTLAIGEFVNMTQYYWVTPDYIYRPMADGSFILDDFSELVKTGRYNKKANIMWGTMQYDFASTVSDNYPDPISIQDFNSTLVGAMRDNRTRSVLLDSPYYQFNSSDNDTVRDQMVAAYTDYFFACPLLKNSQSLASKKASLYAFSMNHGRSMTGSLGGNLTVLCQDKTCHSDDIIPTFGSGDVIPGMNQTGDDARFSRQVIDRLSTFAKTGNPNPTASMPGLANQNSDVMNVAWPLYDSSYPLFELNLNSTVSLNPESDKCKWIEDNVQYLYQRYPPIQKSA
ncbi:hypothetical protein BGZ46_001019 [Entomortierella lignicola]|nr:hypothetical protein BGZ46_001019 [Entomortierella lignicola]